MAAPTLTLIEPAFSHPGGKQLIAITGTDFELPPAVPATGYVGGDVEETVQVEIDGELCTEVKVWTSTYLTCIVPAYRGDSTALTADPGLSVDVLLRNLTGPEEDTFADAFAYRRADLTRADGPLKHFERTIIQEFRRQVIENIVVATTVDFDGDTTDALDIVELAEIPAIALFGPDIQEDKFRREAAYPTTEDTPNLEYSKTRVPRTSVLSYAATMTARSKGEYLQLAQEVLDFFNRNQMLVVDKDPNDSSAGREEFDMFLESGPSRVGSANASDVYSGEFRFIVRGLSIDSDEGVQIEWGKQVDEADDIILQSEGIENG